MEYKKTILTQLLVACTAINSPQIAQKTNFSRIPERENIATSGLAIGDLNKNGLQELVVGDINGVNIYEKDSQERFKKLSKIKQDYFPITSRNYQGASGLAIGNLDNDETLEIIVGDLNGIYIFNRNKKGEWKKTQSIKDGIIPINERDGRGASGLACGDVNGDNKKDIIVGDLNELYVFFNENGNFQKTTRIKLYN